MNLVGKSGTRMTGRRSVAGNETGMTGLIEMTGISRYITSGCFRAHLVFLTRLRGPPIPTCGEEERAILTCNLALVGLRFPGWMSAFLLTIRRYLLYHSVPEGELMKAAVGRGGEKSWTGKRIQRFRRRLRKNPKEKTYLNKSPCRPQHEKLLHNRCWPPIKFLS